MFTRDISLEDCILDLIDNSIDSLLRTQGIDIEAEVLTPQPNLHGRRRGRVEVRYSEDEFHISDNCGGISRKDAEDDVFCFGHGDGTAKGRLGVYGIGLKRAIFKIGDFIEVLSRTTEDSFKVTIDVPQWAAKDTKLSDWTFPLAPLDAVTTKGRAGTAITITDLHSTVKARISDGKLDSTLRTSVAQTYSVFLKDLVDVIINGKPVEQRDLPFGGSTEVEPGSDRFDFEGVKIALFATLAPKDKRVQETAGWYVLCNGRVVVNADKTELTGWGTGVLPAYHSKYRGFVGIALFASDSPLLLPWTTSKRGLNREALVYQQARNRMAALSRPVIKFLNEMYPSELAEAPAQRGVAESVTQRDFRTLLTNPSRQFEATVKTVRKRTTRVQYDVELKDLDRVRKVLRRPSMSASSIGKHTFDHFLKTECPE
jgi:hypothetical protein